MFQNQIGFSLGQHLRVLMLADAFRKCHLKVRSKSTDLDVNILCRSKMISNLLVSGIFRISLFYFFEPEVLGHTRRPCSP